jgi:hypothetical protein
MTRTAFGGKTTQSQAIRRRHHNCKPHHPHLVALLRDSRIKSCSHQFLFNFPPNFHYRLKSDGPRSTYNLLARHTNALILQVNARTPQQLVGHERILQVSTELLQAVVHQRYKPCHAIVITSNPIVH